MKKISLKQYGLQRSGTNYTRMLLLKNYFTNIVANEGGWKHGYYQATGSFRNEAHLIITVKDPFAWLVSICRYSFVHIRKTLPEFIRTKYGFEGLCNSNPIVHWNTMNLHWSNLILNSHKVCVVRYEDLLEYPQEVCDVVAKRVGLYRQENQFYIPKGKVSQNTTEGSGVFDRDFYLQKRYMKAFTGEDVKFIRSQLDERLLEEFYPR